jgi:protein-serine/threonine kinase
VLTARRAAPGLGDDTRNGTEPRGRHRLGPALQIPKNRSTGNLGAMSEKSEKPRIRFSFDASTAPAEYDTMLRSAWERGGERLQLLAGRNLRLRRQTGSVSR